jgi:hypothetical protein
MSEIMGKYRNKLGVELEITGIHNLNNLNVLGTIYEGLIRDSLFGNRLMLVTTEGLTDCGYLKTEGQTA